MPRTDRPPPGDEPVDFVVGAPDDGPDEELPQPEDDQRARTRRLRGQIALGGAGLVVALLIGRGSLTSDSAPHADHSASPSSVPSEPAPTGPVTAPPYLYKNNLPPHPSATTGAPHPAFPASIPRRRGTDPTACPGLHCTTGTALPAPVSDAIQTAFPESVVERTDTVRLTGGDRALWYREVDVRVASQQLTLRVQAPAKGDRTASGHRTSHGQRTTFVSTSLGPWHVEVTVLDLIGGDAPINRLRSLAHDPRIVTV